MRHSEIRTTERLRGELRCSKLHLLRSSKPAIGASVRLTAGPPGGVAPGRFVFFVALEDETLRASPAVAGLLERDAGMRTEFDARFANRALNTSSTRFSRRGRRPTPMLLSRAISNSVKTRPLKSRRAAGIRPSRSSVRRCFGLTERRRAASPMCTTPSTRSSLESQVQPWNFL